MAYRVSIYVGIDGTAYTAGSTDQRGSKGTTGRTVGGRPVEYAGEWYGSQLAYGACRESIRAAWERASRGAAVALTGLVDDCPAGILADKCRDMGRNDLAAGVLALDAAPEVRKGRRTLVLA